MSRTDRIEAMLKSAYELASQGHRPQMIETVLAANGFPEAAEFIEQHHIKKELVGLADQARRSALEGRKGSAMTSRQTLRNESTQGREGNPYPVREASISGRSKRGARSLVSQ